MQIGTRSEESFTCINGQCTVLIAVSPAPALLKIHHASTLPALVFDFVVLLQQIYDFIFMHLYMIIKRTN